MLNVTRRSFVLSAGGSVAAAASLPLLLGVSSCPGGSLNTTLGLINTAVDLFLPFFPMVPAAVDTLVEGWLTNVTNAVELSATELASADSAGVKAEKIAQYFLVAAVPSLSSLGLNADVLARVQGIVNAVETFLKDIGVGSASVKALGKSNVTHPVLKHEQALQIILQAQTLQSQIIAIKINNLKKAGRK